MLEIDPDDRPTPKEALKHEFFKEDKAILKDLIQMNNIRATGEVRKPLSPRKLMALDNASFINES